MTKGKEQKDKQWSTEYCAENPSFFSNTNPTKTETLHVITLYWNTAHNNDPRVALSRESVLWLRVEVMVSNATFNNISFISWWSVLLVEETGIPGKNHRPAASHWQALSHNIVSSTPLHERDSYSELLYMCNNNIYCVKGDFNLI